MASKSGARILGLAYRGTKFPIISPSRCLIHTSRALLSDVDNVRGPSADVPPASNVAWYLRREEASQAATRHMEPIPTIPESSPDNLKHLCQYMVEKLGLTDLSIIDLRGTVVNNSFGPKAIMIVCSGKSERHLGKAAKELLSWLKKVNHVSGYTEGIMTAQLLRIHQRRLRKKAAKKSKYQMLDEYGGTDTLDEDYDNAFKRHSSWVALDTKMDGIYVHLFSGDKRQQLDLEQYWSSPTDREIQIGQQINPSLLETTNTSGQAKKANRFERLYKVPKRAMHTVAAAQTTNSHTTIDPLYAQTSSCVAAQKMKQQLKRLLEFKERCQEEPHLAQTLVPTSDIVKQMMDNFPLDADAEIWRLKLLFLSELRSLNPSQFPLKLFVHHLLYQQASGLAIDQWDITFVMERIVYDEESQRQFRDAQPSYKVQKKWQKHCDEKLNLIMQVHDIAYRSTGEKMCIDDAVMALVLRVLVTPTNDAYSPLDAIYDPSPLPSTLVNDETGQQFGRTLIDDRLFPVLEILGGSYPDSDIQRLTKPMAALVLTSLINSGLWDLFWIFWNKLTERARLEPDLLSLMVALVARSGSESAISFLIERHLPNLFHSEGSAVATPELLQALQKCLQYLDPDCTGYHSIRKYIKVQGEAIQFN